MQNAANSAAVVMLSSEMPDGSTKVVFARPIRLASLVIMLAKSSTEGAI